MYNNDLDAILSAKKGDRETMDKIIIENSGLIWSIVKRFSGRGHDLEDLYQIGCIGFIKSIQRFDESYNVQLSTYAVPYILGEIKRFIRDDGAIKVSRTLKEIYIKIKELEKEYEKRGEQLEIDDISKKLKISNEDVLLAMDSVKPVESINEEVYRDGNVEKQDKIVKTENLENQVINKILLKDALNILNDRERNIILLRYFKEKTQTEVAQIYGISQVQISRIEKKILSKMRDNIKEIS